MGKQKKNTLHDDSGKKILHPAEADRKKFKQKARENRAKNRKKNFDDKMLQMEPQDIQAEIHDLKEMEKKGKLTKWKKDKLSREISSYSRLKEQVEENNLKRLEHQAGDQFHVDFNQLKIHRKSSIYYDPVTNPYGAPPQGAVLMYRHPDGSVQKEPPPLKRAAPTTATGMVPGHQDMVLPNQRPMEVEEAGGESSESEGDDEDEDDDEPMLPSELPDGTVLPSEPAPAAPLPPGPAPLPQGPPPSSALPPMPPGPPPGFGAGRAPPAMPKLPSFAGGPQQSQADFMQHMMNLGYQGKPPPKQQPVKVSMAGPAPGPPPKKAAQELPERKPPGPPPKVQAESVKQPPAKAPVQDVPPETKPPPPPKKAAGPAPLGNAATRFMPTTLRTKKPSQVAGGVLQASSASLSQETRKKTLLREAPKVGERQVIEDAFQDLMHQLDETVGTVPDSK